MTSIKRIISKNDIARNSIPGNDEIFENKEYKEIIDGKFKGNSIKKFGITHYRYNDCYSSDLVAVDKVNIHKDCATAFKEMQAAAKKDGIDLRIVSGYRSSKYQINVFKKKFKDNKGNDICPTDEQMRNRLKYSAPSGFSEHHTGLAIDINDTEERFKDTPAYKWLQAHAKEYGFELSFPENNEQGLGFEPWHWRYVGINGEYKHVFKDARSNDPRFKDEF